jgi:pantothenate kinase-related protein Tda10
VTVDSIPGAGKSIVSYFIYDLLKQKGLDVVEYNSIDFPTIESLEEFGARKDSQEMTEFLNKNVKIKLIDKYTDRR